MLWECRREGMLEMGNCWVRVGDVEMWEREGRERGCPTVEILRGRRGGPANHYVLHGRWHVMVM